ncbi:OR1L8 protein, partial [Polypterus senegalus]
MNQTSVSASEFVLHCTIDSEKKSYTIAILIIVYLVTLIGNFLVVLVIAMNPQLQKPMNVGIANLAVIDLVASTNIIPKLIAILSGGAAVSYGPCLLQLLIAYAALKIPSTDGKKKTLNTVTTHLLVVALSNIPILISTMLNGIGVKLTWQQQRNGYCSNYCAADVQPLDIQLQKQRDKKQHPETF